MGGGKADPGRLVQLSLIRVREELPELELSPG